MAVQLRKDDRNYQKDDELWLFEYMPMRDEFTGRSVIVHVSDVIRNFEGLMPGYCILSIKLPPSATKFMRDVTSMTAAQFGEKFKEELACGQKA